jgi:hypothetical protein
MRIYAAALAAISGSLIGGCFSYSHREYQEPPARVVYVPVGEGQTNEQAVAQDLEARLQAANGITSFVEKDAALGEIAVSAASAADAEITRRSLAQMTSFTARDEASQRAAMMLACRGRRSEAIGIANGMTSFTKRDETLARLASR